MRTAGFDPYSGLDRGTAGDGLPVMTALWDHMRPWLLVVALIVGGLLACGYSAIEGRIPFVLEYLPVVPHLAINLSQACLLGVWAAFSRAPRWVRLAGLIVGAVALEILLATGYNDGE